MVLVTGATGILGRIIALELLKRGFRVRATRRAASDVDDVRRSFRFYTDKADYYFDQIDWVETDFQDLDSLRAAVSGCSQIYHCAAYVSFHPAAAKKIYRINVEGTQNLLYVADDQNIEKFCFISSIASVDTLNSDGLVDEESEWDFKTVHSDYAISKKFSEMEVWRASAEGLNVVIINPGIIIGSGNWENSSGTIYRSLSRSPFTATGGTAYADVRDVAFCAVGLMERNQFGQRFITISENKSYAAVATRIRKAFGKKAPIVVNKAVLTVGRILNILLGWAVPSLRMVNAANVAAISHAPKYSNKKVRETLGMDFIPVEQAIAFHLNNYKEDQHLTAK